jgi:REP-associated tyrosine transposase
MARALRLEFDGALYHLCARGNRRERIFADEKDCLHFLALLKESVSRYEVEIHAYVLLPNRFHLLAGTPRANLSRWMHWLVGAYSIFFNRRHRKSGHLFQGRYKSFLVEGGNYLLGLSRYMHLNPVRGRVMGAGDPKERRKRLRAYRWSSYRGYADLGKQNDFVSEELVLGELGGNSLKQQKLRYRRFVEEGLLREIENPFEAVQWQMVLGSESLLQSVKDKLRSKSGHRREVTGLRHSTNKHQPRELVARVASHYGISMNRLLREAAYGSEARNLAIWLAWQKCGLTLREIGLLFGGMDYAAVSQRIRRIQKRAETDRKLKRTLEMLNV